jgi:hypothetical protein
MSLNLVGLDDARQAMLTEVERDIAAGALYRSKRLTDAGWAVYPDLLRDAITHGDDVTLTGALAQPQFWFAQEQSQSSKGKVFMKNVPVNAHETLAESEFNRFYLRGLCRVALDRGIIEVVVYRAKAVSVPRPESEALIGTSLDPAALLEDLRNSIGVDTALGLPPGPNSGLSGKLSA